MSHGVYWAGIACALDPRAPARYTRARGLEPATATVGIPLRAVSSLVPVVPPNPFLIAEATSPAALAYLNSPTPAPDADGAPVPMPFAGDLVFVQDDGDGTIRTTLLARAMYFVEALIVDPENQDRTNSGSSPLLAVQLVGIQRWWDTHGEITREWNKRRGPPERFATAQQDQPDASTKAALAERLYHADTCDDGIGVRPTPLRTIIQDCLRALPGNVGIVTWPAGSHGPPEDVRAWGASPKEVAATLLEHYGLHIDIGPDLKARVFKRGEGVIGEAGE